LSNHQTYDYIILGSGCAGLSLALRLSESKIPFKKILIIDREVKTKNDRTWCFWSKEKETWYTKLASKNWNQFNFYTETLEYTVNLSPYKYYHLKSKDFYDYCIGKLKNDQRFDFATDTIKQLVQSNGKVEVVCQRNTYHSQYVFNSAFRNQNIKPDHVNYVQHFLGWVIKTNEPKFKEFLPTFMDFRVPQQDDCRFCYVIPYSETEALVEYTGFSPTTCEKEVYEEALKNYISAQLMIEDYTVLETEYGEIPMAQSKFVNPFGGNVINIGTAGGSSKASTGYTFIFIQRQVEELIKRIENKQNLIGVKTTKSKYSYFDSVFLKVLASKKINGKQLFQTLFKYNKPEELLAFLNEESSAITDLKIMNSVPKDIFIPIALKQLIRS